MEHQFQHEIITKLLTQKLPLALPEEFLHPYYSGASILNIPASITANFGASPFGRDRLLPEIESRLFPKNYRHVALLLVDGLGYDWLMAYLAKELNSAPENRFWSNALADAEISPLTSISPSTTATALSTLWTGEPPAAHGILGYELWLKEFGILSNMILHTPAASRNTVGSLYNAGMNATDFVPSKAIARHLNEYGVKTRSFQHQSIVNSGLSAMLDEGAERLPYRTISDMWINFEQALQAQPQQPSYNWLYWSEHDSLGHPYGVEDPRVYAEFEQLGLSIINFLRRMRAAGRHDLLLLITADHGHLVTPKVPRYTLSNAPEFAQTLAMLPSGDNRLPYLYVKPGQEMTMQTLLRHHWTLDEFALMPSQQALQGGLFGPPPFYSRAIDRIGEWLLLPRELSYLWWSERPNPLLGRHGGLSRTEMLVPLIALEL